MSGSHSRNVRVLYKTLLRLHRGLPPELSALGDGFMKEEFRRHKDSQPPLATEFLRQWTEYARGLANQLSLKAIKRGEKVGRNLEEGALEGFREDQVVQLYELMKASTGVYDQPK